MEKSEINETCYSFIEFINFVDLRLKFKNMALNIKLFKIQNISEHLAHLSYKKFVCFLNLSFDGGGGP